MEHGASEPEARMMVGAKLRAAVEATIKDYYARPWLDCLIIMPRKGHESSGQVQARDHYAMTHRKRQT